MKKYYHATPAANLDSILSEGIKVGFDKVVYLAESASDALKFILIRCSTDILVCEVELDESMVEESFDHSYDFFKCRAYVYDSNISVDSISNLMMYKR